MNRCTGRVLFISQSASPEGGVETWLDEISMTLNGVGWSAVTALVKGYKAHRPECFRACHHELDFVEIDGRGLDAEGRTRAAIRCIRRVRPDVVIPLTVVDGHEAAARWRRRHPGGRYVLAVHGNVPAQLADAYRYLPAADLAISPGALTCRLLEDGGMPADRIRHVPNGAREPSTAAVPRVAADPLRLVYVGRVAGSEKRAGDLVPLVEALETRRVLYRLTVAGDGPLKGTLQEQLTAPGISRHVEFIGRVTQDELYERVYPRSDVLLLFSESEAFGIVVVEAMKHGVVPVTSRFVGAGAEGILRDGENCFLFDTGCVDDAARRIQSLSRAPGRLSRMSEACRSQAAGYTWTACCESWIQALSDVMSWPDACKPAIPPRPNPASGRLERWPVPAAFKDGVRRVRRLVRSVDPAMVGGEEWPFANRFHDRLRLAAIEARARELEGQMSRGAA